MTVVEGSLDRSVECVRDFRHMSRRTSLLPITMFSLLTCDDGTGPGPGPTVDRVLVMGPSSLYLGQTAQFQAAPLSAAGDTLPRPIEWASSDTAVVTVSATGVVTTRAVGVVSISALAEGKVGSAPLSVALVPVVRVDVTPGNIDSLYVGDSLQLEATPRDSAGGALPDRSVTWATSDTTKATVTRAGLVRTRAAGSFTVTATSELRTGGVFLYAQYRVASLAMPDSFSLELSRRVRIIPDLRSASGTHLSGRPVTWTSSDRAVLDVDQNGIVTPHVLGMAAVTARSLEFSDSALITVIPDSVARLEFVYRYFNVPGDSTVDAIQAHAYGPTGAVALGNSFSWASSDTMIARARPSPAASSIVQVTGLAPGRANITATAAGVSLTGSVYVRFGPSQLVVHPDTISVPEGRGVVVLATGVDRFGNRVDISGLQQYAIQDTVVAAMDFRFGPPIVSGRQAGRTSLIVRLSNEMADTAVVIVQDTTRPFLSWEAVVSAPYPYSAVPFILRAYDSSGAPGTVPRSVQLASSDTTVAIPAVAVLTGMTAVETVTVITRRGGAATLHGTSDSLFTSIFITVYDIPPSRIEISETPTVVRVGDTLRLHATVRGEDGGIRGYPLVWSTSDSGRATISDSGLMTALHVGDVMLFAASGMPRDTVSITVRSTDSPMITNVAPAPLTPGATIVIRGQGFDPDPAVNAVLVDSIPAFLTSASDTALTIVLPPSHAWPCSATHQARLLVRSGGRLAVDSAPFSVATQRPRLAPGDALVLEGAEAACNELAPVGGNALYVVSAANTSSSSPISFAFASDAAMIAASPPAAQELVTTNRTSPGVAISLDSLRRSALAHRRLLEQSRDLTRRAGAPGPLLRAARQMTPRLSVTATINGVARVRIPRLEDPDFCSSYRSIDANIVYSGTHAVILEDRNAPLAGMMGDLYQALGREFDTSMYPTLLANFGDPLVLDSLLDGDGRIAIVFSRIVNNYGVAGFVVSCDFYPESVAPSSNTGEILYAQVPTAAGTGFGAYTADVWRWLIRSVVMHESKHLTAFAERLSRGAAIEDPWLEEASAVLAEELWSRPIYGATWKGDALYRSTLYCDVRPTFPECTGRPYSMFNAWAFLYDYIRQLERRTPLGPATFDDATFYGSGWSFLRWAIDQSSAPESDFLRQLVQEPSLTGVANLAARTNRPFAEMLSDWSDALYCETWGLATVRSAWMMPSWKTEDIFIGMNQDFPVDFPDGHPLRGFWPVGAQFPLTTTGLPPGGWALFAGERAHVTRQLLHFSSTTGGPPPTSLRVQLFRFR